MEKSLGRIIAENIDRYLVIYEMTQLDLARRLGVSTASVSNWMNGKKIPRAERLDAICAIFHCRRADLVTEGSGGQSGIYAELLRKIKLLDYEDAVEIEAIIDLKLGKEKYKKISAG